MVRVYPVKRKIDPMGSIVVSLDKVLNRKRDKAKAEGINLTNRRIELETGLATNTLKAWLRKTIKSADLATLATLCDYFECEPSDILIYDRDAE